MTVEKLLKILRKNNIPLNVTIMSDSGWECYETDCDGVYYDTKLHCVVLEQDAGEDYDNRICLNKEDIV